VQEEYNSDDLRELLDDLTSRLVDGFLLFDPLTRFERSELDRLCRGVPYVVMSGEPGDGIPGVYIDNQAGMESVIDHLTGLGHRKIAEVCGPLDVYDARVRHETYLKRLHESGLEPGPCLSGNFRPRMPYEHTINLLEKKTEFSAVVCANDDSALGVMRALHERGIRIPEDVSVTGFDDHPLVKYYEPPLTTVRQDYGILSREAVQILVGMVETREPCDRQIRLCPELVVRQSTSRPPN